MKYICENCGKEHDGSFGTGRFCNNACKTAYCNSKRIVSDTTKEKISNALKGKKKHKERYCKICGNVIANTNSKSKFCSCHCKHINNFINTLVKYFYFDENVIGTNEVFNEIDRIRKVLYKLYWDDELNANDISKKFNYPSSSNLVAKIFNYLSIPVRTITDAVNLSIKQGNYKIRENNKSHHGWHTTWNNKTVYYRSKNELDYAIELDSYKIDYDMECLRIKYFDTLKQKYRYAIPDFYIQSINTIIEIKSLYTLDIQNMSDKFKAYEDLGYNVKCICDYKEIEIPR